MNTLPDWEIIRFDDSEVKPLTLDKMRKIVSELRSEKLDTLIFENEKQFLDWLKIQPETNYAYNFVTDSKYPIQVVVERKNNKVVITEQ